MTDQKSELELLIKNSITQEDICSCEGYSLVIKVLSDLLADHIFSAGYIKKSEIRVDKNELEKVLGDIKIPIDESWCEVEETSNPAVIILKSKWARKIVKAISLNLTKIVK